MVDRLNGLRHDAIIGGDDEDDDVGNLGATGTHGREGLVAGRVDERDGAAIDGDLGGADGLRDATGLACRDAGVADRVEQRRLAVVDVAHDRDDRGARLERVGIVVEREGVLLLLGHDLDVAPEVVGHELDELVRHRLGEGERRSEQEQALDDVVGGNAEKLGEVAYRGALRDAHGVELREVLVVREGLLDTALLGSLRSLAHAALLAALAAAGGLAVCLLDGLAGLIEDAVAVVRLGLAGHAAVPILAVVSAAILLAALAAARAGVLGRGRRSVLGGRLGLGGGALGVAVGALVLLLARALGRLLRCVGLLLALLGGSGLSLLALEHLLLLGDLVEQAGERRLGARRGIAHAVLLGLLGGLPGLLLGLATSLLLLGLAALLLRLASRLLGGTLGLALCLGGEALALSGLGGDTGGLGGSLLLGLARGLDLGGAGLEDRLELLTDDGQVRVLDRRGCGLRGDLHLYEMLEHLLGSHAIFLGELADSGLCHAQSSFSP